MRFQYRRDKGFGLTRYRKRVQGVAAGIPHPAHVGPACSAEQVSDRANRGRDRDLRLTGYVTPSWRIARCNCLANPKRPGTIYVTMKQRFCPSRIGTRSTSMTPSGHHGSTGTPDTCPIAQRIPARQNAQAPDGANSQHSRCAYGNSGMRNGDMFPFPNNRQQMALPLQRRRAGVGSARAESFSTSAGWHAPGPSRTATSHRRGRTLR
jgi:hypothetical protein